jgi:hypothetical protein
MKSCGKRFHDEVGKFRFLNELIKVVSPKVNHPSPKYICSIGGGLRIETPRRGSPKGPPGLPIKNQTQHRHRAFLMSSSSYTWNSLGFWEESFQADGWWVAMELLCAQEALIPGNAHSINILPSSSCSFSTPGCGASPGLWQRFSCPYHPGVASLGP